jgi:hypothetical protein
MARVLCSVSETTLENDDGHEVDGVVVTCSRCDHATQSFGTGEASVRRCLVLLREECPEGEANFYVSEDD